VRDPLDPEPLEPEPLEPEPLDPEPEFEPEPLDPEPLDPEPEFEPETLDPEPLESSESAVVVGAAATEVLERTVVAARAVVELTTSSVPFEPEPEFEPELPDPEPELPDPEPELPDPEPELPELSAPDPETSSMVVLDVPPTEEPDGPLLDLEVAPVVVGESAGAVVETDVVVAVELDVVADSVTGDCPTVVDAVDGAAGVS
jgi:hypothetical protein